MIWILCDESAFCTKQQLEFLKRLWTSPIFWESSFRDFANALSVKLVYWSLPHGLLHQPPLLVGSLPSSSPSSWPWARCACFIPYHPNFWITKGWKPSGPYKLCPRQGVRYVNPILKSFFLRKSACLRTCPGSWSSATTNHRICLGLEEVLSLVTLGVSRPASCPASRAATQTGSLQHTSPSPCQATSWIWGWVTEETLGCGADLPHLDHSAPTQVTQKLVPASVFVNLLQCISICEEQPPNSSVMNRFVEANAWNHT